MNEKSAADVPVGYIRVHIHTYVYVCSKAKQVISNGRVRAGTANFLRHLPVATLATGNGFEANFQSIHCIAHVTVQRTYTYLSNLPNLPYTWSGVNSAS